MACIVRTFCYVISALIQSYFNTNTTILWLILAFIFMGAGWGSILGPTSAAAINSLPKKNAGIATGVLWTIQVLGGAIGIAIVGVLFQSKEHSRMFQTLKQAHLILTQKQQQFISQLLVNPQDISQSSHFFFASEQLTVLKDYTSAFLSGYQHSMLFY